MHTEGPEKSWKTLSLFCMHPVLHKTVFVILFALAK